jgi:uncharacterized protein
VAKKSFFTLALFGVLLIGCSSPAASLPEFTAPVVDSIGRVSAEVETQINSELISFQQSGGPQIAVAVVDTTGNATPENYSIDLARSWGIGEKEKDNGVLLLIALEDRTLRIEVGSGVEGELTDVTAGGIVDSVMLPRLRANDVDGAVRDGARAVMQVWRGEGIAPQPIVPNTPATESTTQQSPFGIALFFGLILLFVTLAVRGKRNGGGMLGPFGAGTIYGGGFGNHRGGFGGGFGGFGGGGGGGFSGGGAGGSW